VIDSERERRQLYCLAISAKRYVLYHLRDDGQEVLVKWSGHGLAHLLNPTDPESTDRDWIRQAWEWLLRNCLRGLGPAEGQPGPKRSLFHGPPGPGALGCALELGPRMRRASSPSWVGGQGWAGGHGAAQPASAFRAIR
jgi:hypothetical protein